MKKYEELTDKEKKIYNAATLAVTDAKDAYEKIKKELLED